MRRISLNARQAQDAIADDQIEVVLAVIEHPGLVDGPVRVSTDNADRFSLEPLLYGTYSTWRGDGQRNPFYYVGMDALLPDDKDETDAQAQFVLDVLDGNLVDVLRNTIVPAKCSIAVVMAATPDFVEVQYAGLQMSDASGDFAQVSIKFGMKPLYDEPFPAIRMTKERFPGLHR